MLDDKYRIERLLATGGMGAVYLGTHIRLRKRVAIKVLNPQLSTAAMVARFHREAITASQIGHEGIAQVTDLGTSGEGEPFLVMEYLEGESLAARLQAHGPLAIEEACEIGCAILSPLSAAHQAGIVHRDLKPDNVYLVRQSRGEMVKLLDFGISRTKGLDSEFRLTNTGIVLGTPYYMSPEQARGEAEITPAADLYAFGVILYEMLVGEVPIRAENYNQLMYRVTIGDFAPPREQRPDLPEALERIILHAMAQAPKDRPASAMELEQALLAFCRPAFRDPTGSRISAPGLSFKTPPTGSDIRALRASIDPAMFTGPTMSDGAPAGSYLPPGDTSLDLVLGAVTNHDEHASQPALRTFTTSYGDLGTHEAPRRSRAARMLIGIAVVAVAAVVAGSLVIAIARRSGRSLAVTPIPAPVGPTSGATSKPPVTPIAPPVTNHSDSTEAPASTPAVHEPTTIMLRFAVEPSGAAITVDGKRVSGTELAVPQDASPHRLRITAAGYVGHEETISFDESQRLIVRLDRAAGPMRGKDPHKDRSKPDRTDRTDRTDRIESQSPYAE